MRTINYESDFKIIEGFKDGSSILAAPFRFTYYTKVSRGVYVAEYNGSEYVNCIPTEDGKVIVPFDSPKLGMGMLMVKREFFLNDSDFADGVCNLVSVESTGITLDKGATDDLGEIEVLVEPYYHTANGGGDIENGSITEIKLADDAVSTKKIKNGSVTEDKLSEEVKEKLNQQSGGYEPPVGGIPKTDLSEEVQSSLGKADTALQEHQDLSSYATLAKVQEIAEDIVTKDAHSSDIQGLQEDIEELASIMITAEPAEGDSEEVEDYVLMKSDVDGEIDSNSNNPVTNEAIARALEAAVARGRELAKRDLYIAAGAEYNDTDSVIKKTAFWGAEVDHLPHHYYLNGLGDITEEEMEVIYKYKECMSIFLSSPDNNKARFFQDGGFVPRTLFVAFRGNRAAEVININSNSAANPFAHCANLQVIKWLGNKGLSVYGSTAIRTDYGLFFNCPKLEVIDAITPNKDVYGSQCVNLIECRFTRLDYNVTLSTNRKISKESVLYMIQNVLKSTTKALVITLHADTYAKCIEGGEWHEEVQSALDAANAAITGGGSINIASA